MWALSIIYSLQFPVSSPTTCGIRNDVDAVGKSLSWLAEEAVRVGGYTRTELLGR